MDDEREEQHLKSQPQQNNYWEGKVSAELPTTNPEQIWSFFKDFFNLHNYFPSLTTCYGIQGNNSEIGCIRYCAGSSSIPPSSNSTTDSGSIVESDNRIAVSWSKERLVELNEEEMSLSYVIVESNIGFESYRSTVRVRPREESGESITGCVIEWLFGVDPVNGLEFRDLVKKYEVGLHRMARRMEELAN